ATHRLDGAVDTGPGGHHDDRRRRVEPLEPCEQVQPFRPRGRVAGVVHVDQEGVEVALVESGKDGAGGSGTLDLVALALEEELESFQDVLLIVGDEDAGGGRAHGVKVSGVGCRVPGPSWAPHSCVARRGPAPRQKYAV